MLIEVRLSPDGTVRWEKPIHLENQQVVLDPFGQPVFAGTFDGKLRLDDITLRSRTSDFEDFAGPPTHLASQGDELGAGSHRRARPAHMGTGECQLHRLWPGSDGDGGPSRGGHTLLPAQKTMNPQPPATCSARPSFRRLASAP